MTDASTIGRQPITIVEIDQEEVTSPAQVAQKVKDARAAGKKKSILVMIERQGEQRFVGLSLGS